MNGVILGDRATLLRTVDGGNSWQQVVVPLFQSLFNIPLVDMSIPDNSTGYIVGSFGLILKTTDKGANWKRQIGITGDEDFTGVSFSNNQSGIIVGREGLIYKTYDGGLTWTRINISYSGNFSGVYFVNQNKVYAWGREGGGVYKVFLSQNGGSNWQEVSNLSDPAIYQMQFLSDNIGFYSTYSGYSKVFKTIDGGTTWTDAVPSYSSSNNPIPFWFTSPQTGYFGSVFSIYKTTDGGTNIFSSYSFNDYYLKDYYFINANIGFGVGSSNQFYDGAGRFAFKTTNGGVTWQVMDSLRKFDASHNNAKSIIDAINPSPNNYFVTARYFSEGKSPVLVSRDGGNSWLADSMLSAEPHGYKFGAVLKNGGLAYHDDKYFFLSQDGGAQWIKDTLNLPDTIFYESRYLPINWISADTFIVPVFTPSGNKLMYTLNRANTWQSISLPAGFQLSKFKFFNTDTGYVIGQNAHPAIYRTYNRGVSWQNVFNPDTLDNGFNKADFINDSTILIIASTVRHLYKTSNRGLTWKELSLPDNPFNNNPVQVFDFHNEAIGAVATSDWSVYTTNDSAKTWFLQLIGLLQTDYIRGMRYFNSDNLFIYGDQARLDRLTNYFPLKPDLIKGPTVVRKDSAYEYIIPLDLFAYDTKWEATGGAIIYYDSVYPERARIKWNTPGNYKVTAYTKNYCGNSPIQELNVTVSAVTGINQPTNDDDCRIFPVPTKGKIYFSFKFPDKYNELSLYSLDGKLLLNKKIDRVSNMELDLSSFSRGVYMIKLNSRSDHKIWIKKIVLQ
jgi:photosystem II stability/assembly factor-like uncharacterized protein